MTGNKWLLECPVEADKRNSCERDSGLKGKAVTGRSFVYKKEPRCKTREKQDKLTKKKYYKSKCLWLTFESFILIWHVWIWIDRSEEHYDQEEESKEGSIQGASLR